MDKVIIDSDVIIGDLIPGDANHLRSERVYEQIRDEDLNVIVTNLVIYEVATLLSRRHTQEQAVIFLDKIFSSEYQIIYVDELLSQKIVNKFKSYSKKNISFVDCANLVVSEELHIPKIFSFDRIYGEKRLKL